MASSHGNSVNKRQLLWLVLSLVALYAVVPQLGSFRHSLSTISQAHQSDLAAAAAFMLLTYAAAAGTYCWLSFSRLSYPRTVLVEIAGMFVNRLLPAGIGAIGVNYAYLHKNRHSASQAAGVVALNNALGIFGHVVVLAVVSALYHASLPTLRSRHSHTSFIAGITLILAAALLIVYAFYGERLRQGLRDFSVQLLSYRERPWSLFMALLCSISLTLCNLLCLWFCVLSVGASLPFVAVLLVFTFGVALGTATPTPGGLGGVEAGLVAGLVAYQVPGSAALAAVLLFRLITYWLPLLAGGPAFVYSQRRRYL
jgi:uncharacterized membrane protein YbhN (UPF0104 family)